MLTWWLFLVPLNVKQWKVAKSVFWLQPGNASLLFKLNTGIVNLLLSLSWQNIFLHYLRLNQHLTLTLPHDLSFLNGTIFLHKWIIFKTSDLQHSNKKSFEPRPHFRFDKGHLWAIEQWGGKCGDSVDGRGMPVCAYFQLNAKLNSNL